MKLLACSAVIAIASSSVLASAATCSARSPAHTVALVELYTSEGCSSCPPADRWLSSIRKSGFGPESVVPLALHVDYWDYIGWKDPFARPLFSARQRQLAGVTGRSFVYTPQVMVAGRDYRGWSSARSFAEDVKRTNAASARAAIDLEIARLTADNVRLVARANVAEPRYRSGAYLHLALYRNGLVTAVKAGENRGVTLRHDFVARDWAEPVALGRSGAAEATVEARLPATVKGVLAGAVAFVQNRNTGEVLQAFSLAVCGT